MNETTTNYTDFFGKAFRRKDEKPPEPFTYQIHLAEESLPDLLEVPTGAGKTAAVLGAWLWRRINKPETVGRRLIYCLPMRTLVEQTKTVAENAIEKLNLKERFSVHVLLGGEVDERFEHEPEKEAIIIGTQDMLLSRALNRGYAMSRYKWAVHFGLLNNDCLWVFDEVQLFGDGLPTTTQLAAFRERFGTFGNCHSLWMSATLERDWLKTVDFKGKIEGLQIIELSEADKNADVLARRLNAVKVLQKADDNCREPKPLAEFIAGKHERGTQTLIVVNTVKRAQDVFAELEKLFKKVEDKPEIELIHSRFRPFERKAKTQMLNAKILLEGAGRIVVATQVVEAGVDISSKLLITDLAPFSSLVQRFGRCNRNGEHDLAEIFWIDLDEKNAKPYEFAELADAKAQLEKLASASIADLEAFKNNADFIKQKFQPAHVLRRRDLVDLFDTTPDLSGFDIDVSRFVRGGDERDVSVFWRENVEETIKKSPKTKLKKELAPSRDELCGVPIHELKDFLKNSAAWTFDALTGEWQKVEENRLRPGMIVLLEAASGGYNENRGWDKQSKKEKVKILSPDERAKSEAYDDEPWSFVHYEQTLAAHSLETRSKLEKILDKLSLPGLVAFQTELSNAAQHHDWGKAHQIFQRTLHGIESDAEFEVRQPLEPVLAKTVPKKVKGHSRKKFRHELASALALLQTGASDLTVYLAACHHGKVRLSIRALPDESKPDSSTKKFARGIWDEDILPETDLGDGLQKAAVTLDLAPMLLGSNRNESKSWLERMIALRDRDDLGVFRLAFLESLIRAADVQASKEPQEVLPEKEIENQ